MAIGRRFRRTLLGGVLAALVLVLALVVAPSLLVPSLERGLTAATGAAVRIGWITWNPLRLRARVHDVSVAPLEDAPPLVTFAAIDLDLSVRDLLAGRLVLDELHLDRPWVDLRRTPAGDFDLALLRSPPPNDGASGDSGSAPSRTTPASSLTIARFTIDHGSVEFHDETTTPPLETSLYVDAASARDLRIASSGEGRVALRLESRFAEQPLVLDVAYHAAAQDSDLRVTLETSNVALDRVLVEIPLGWQQLSGSLDATVTYHREVRDGRLRAHALAARATARDVAVVEPWADEPPLRAVLVRLPDVTADLLTQHVDLGTIEVEGMSLLLLRGEQGLHVPLSTTSTGGGDSGWTTHVAAVTLDRGTVIVRDLLPGAPALVAELRRGIVRPGARAVAFDAEAAVAAGRMTVDGRLEGSAVHLALGLERLGVPDVAAHLGLPVAFTEGEISGQLDAVFRNGTGHFTGTLALVDVKSAPSAGHPEEVFAWHTLDLTLADTTFVPPRIRIARAAVTWPYVMLHRRADGVYPFLDAAPAPPSATPAPAEAEAEPVLVIDHGTITGGRVEFYDTVLPVAYGTHLLGLTGSVVGLRVAPLTAERFALEGSLDELSPVTVHGTLGRHAGEGAVSIDRLLLAPLNPYLQPALSYEVRSGIATVSSRISHRGASVEAANTLVLSRFVLRAAGEDRFAAELGAPLTVALGLMKDSRGRIHLDLPVEIDLDTQSYRVRTPLLAAVRDAMLGALRSPLRLLGSAFRRDEGERFDLEPVPFTAGSAEIAPDTDARLAEVAGLLYRYPSLRAVFLPAASSADVAALGAAADRRRLEALVAARQTAIAERLRSHYRVPDARVTFREWGEDVPVSEDAPGLDLELRDR